jgi:hypothetical protein
VKSYYVWCDACHKVASGRIIAAKNKPDALREFRVCRCGHRVKDLRCIDGVRFKLTP